MVPFEDARALAVGPLGALYVLDAATATVDYIDPVALVRQTIYGGTGLGRDALLGPQDLAEQAGLLYLADTGNGRLVVLKLDPDEPGDTQDFDRFPVPIEEGDIQTAQRTGNGGFESERISGEGEPIALAVATNGTIYAVEAQRGRVWSWDVLRRPRLVRNTPANPRDVCVEGDRVSRARPGRARRTRPPDGANSGDGTRPAAWVRSARTACRGRPPQAGARRGPPCRRAARGADGDGPVGAPRAPLDPPL